MKRLITKADRLELIKAHEERLIKDGYTKEEYKRLTFWTKTENGFLLKIFRGTQTKPLQFTRFTTEKRRSQIIQNHKENENRVEEWKQKEKAKPSGAAGASAAIKKELSALYLGVQFSVRSEVYSGGDSVRISWTDGPTVEEVENIVNKYQAGHFNSMEDIYEYKQEKTDLPQAKYVQTSRTISPEIENFVTEEVKKILGDNLQGYEVYRILNKTEIAPGSTPLRLEAVKDAGLFEDCYKLIFEQPEQTEAPQIEPIELKAGEVQIIEYSEKSIAIVGDTKPIKDKLKELGGKFNFRLSCGPGWIFPKSKIETIQNALTA